MNEEELLRLATWKLTGQTTCAGCKYLYIHSISDSIFPSRLNCAWSKNPDLVAEIVHISPMNLPDFSRISALQNNRCEKYAHTAHGLEHFDFLRPLPTPAYFDT